MTRYWLLVLGVCWGGAVGGCHTVQLDSDPPGARVYVDGVYWGTTPCSHTWVLGQKAAGYRSAMVLPGYDLSDCPDLPRTAAIHPAESLMISAPNGAKVYVNGNLVGTSPLFRNLPFPQSIRAVWPKNVLANSRYRPEHAGQAPPTVAPPTPTPPPSRPPAAPLAGPVRNRFAVVVGISKYKLRGKWGLTNLRYAARDAAALANYLRTPKGGRFDHVSLLTDEQATTRNIKIALREKLRGVQPDDLVLVYWSGHGGPDPHETDKLYLITHDTDPEHLPSTSYSMAEFKTDMASLRAKRVLVLADTCHSAGISDPKIGIRGPKDNKIVEGIKGVYVASDAATKAGPLKMIFTSCEAGEVSIESSKLGGGHGVFTWFLLKGLQGGADQPKVGGNADGKVTLGEVIEYTRDQVKRYTGNQQHPDTAGRFDRSVIMGSSK